MCGRFSLAISKEKLQKELPFIEPINNLHQSYNIAPTQPAYVVASDQPTRLQNMAWGLVPNWSNDGKNSGRLINARREGIEGKPSFRVPIRKQRCLVPADSFYEWRREGTRKIPYRIFSKDGNLLVFAGVWDLWSDGENMLKTFSIITTTPNFEMSGIHNRMPVLLQTKEQQDIWLQSGDMNEIMSILQTPADGTLEMYRVSQLVNAVGNDSSELHLEVPEPPTLYD